MTRSELEQRLAAGLKQAGRDNIALTEGTDEEKRDKAMENVAHPIAEAIVNGDSSMREATVSYLSSLTEHDITQLYVVTDSGRIGTLDVTAGDIVRWYDGQWVHIGGEGGGEVERYAYTKAETDARIAVETYRAKDIEAYLYRNIMQIGGEAGAHASRTDNPHNVTAQQVGADPAGTAASAVSAHDASSTSHEDIRALISAEAQVRAAADDGKVDKVSGKGLSTNDYTTAEKTKLAGIAAGAEVNVQSDWNQSDSSKDDFIKNKPQNLVQDASYVHTDNNYTTAEKTKLAGIAEGAQVNNIFVAVYSGNHNDAGNTPYADINAAYLAGKRIMCWNGAANARRLYTLNGFNATDKIFTFTSCGGSGEDILEVSFAYMEGNINNTECQTKNYLLAKRNHASTTTAYGTGTSSRYGHVKLSDSTSSTSGVSDGVAATPSAVKAAYDLANGKQEAITGAATTITSSNLTASMALVSDSSGKVAVSAVTSTELGYMDGVTSNVQYQLDGKLPLIDLSITNRAYDFNSTAVTGVYRFIGFDSGSDITWTNAPPDISTNRASNFAMIVTEARGRVRQIFMDGVESTTGVPRICVRHRNNSDGGQWGAWKEIAYTDGSNANASGVIAALNKLGTDTEDALDNDYIICSGHTSGSTDVTFIRRTFTHLFNRIRAKLGISSSGSTTKYLSEHGTFENIPESSIYDCGYGSTSTSDWSAAYAAYNAGKLLIIRDSYDYIYLSVGAVNSGLRFYRFKNESSILKIGVLAWGRGSTPITNEMEAALVNHTHRASDITAGQFGTDRIANDAITAAKVNDGETLPVDISGTAAFLRFGTGGQARAINFKGWPTGANGNLWFNNVSGDTLASDSSNSISRYIFGNRAYGVDGVTVVAGRFRLHNGTNPGPGAGDSTSGINFAELKLASDASGTEGAGSSKSNPKIVLQGSGNPHFGVFTTNVHEGTSARGIMLDVDSNLVSIWAYGHGRSTDILSMVADANYPTQKTMARLGNVNDTRVALGSMTLDLSGQFRNNANEIYFL